MTKRRKIPTEEDLIPCKYFLLFESFKLAAVLIGLSSCATVLDQCHVIGCSFDDITNILQILKRCRAFTPEYEFFTFRETFVSETDYRFFINKVGDDTVLFAKPTLRTSVGFALGIKFKIQGGKVLLCSRPPAGQREKLVRIVDLALMYQNRSLAKVGKSSTKKFEKKNSTSPLDQIKEISLQTAPATPAPLKLQLMNSGMSSLATFTPIFDLAAINGGLRCDSRSLLGRTIFDRSAPVYVNTSEPFCCVCCGVQGAGKSYTINTIIESMMIPDKDVNPHLSSDSIASALVVHYDDDPSSICESVGLALPRYDDDNSLQCPKVHVMVSSTFYKQRKQQYSSIPGIEVHPLLFQFSSLTAEQLKILMGVQQKDHQLYMMVIMDILRKWQRGQFVSDFQRFEKMLLNPNPDEPKLMGQQSIPLMQRIQLLRSLVVESGDNEELKNDFVELTSVFKPGNLVVVDLTNPLLEPDEANSIFRVVLQKYRSTPLNCGKLAVLDEAHKYLDKELGRLCVALVRTMRHHGTRIAISTQSPRVIPDEMLELLSFAVIHHFFSPDWMNFLSSKLPISRDALRDILRLQCGQSLLYSSRGRIDSLCEKYQDYNQSFAPVQIRERLTMDLGHSIMDMCHRMSGEQNLLESLPIAFSREKRPVPSADSLPSAEDIVNRFPVSIAQIDPDGGGDSSFSSDGEDEVRTVVKQDGGDDDPDGGGDSSFSSDGEDEVRRIVKLK